MNNALGLVEAIGLAPAIVATDTMSKAANINLIGLERSKGSGMFVIKIEGDVGAVTAAIASIKSQAELRNKIYATQVIPRPAKGIEKLINNPQNLGIKKRKIKEPIPEPVPQEEPQESKAVPETEVLPEPEAVPEPKKATKIKTESKDKVCNLCNDPKCQRRRGEPKVLCIHHTPESK